MSISSDLIATNNDISRLDRDAIDAVFIHETPSSRRASDNGERPSRYLVRLRGETRRRRVYATPIGNVSALYLKSGGALIHCESAIDSALYR